jgi:Smg protein
MLDVLLYLFEHYVDEARNAPRDEAVLKSMLEDAGFRQADIHKAFAWLEDLMRQRDGGTSTGGATGGSFRIFSREECLRLNRDCRGYLLALERGGLVDAAAREQIIDRALALELEELDLERFKLIIMIVLANQPGEEHLQDWLEALIFDNLAGRVH